MVTKRNLINVTKLTRQEKSAIIGHWRSGASCYEISYVTGKYIDIIEIVIEQHKKYLSEIEDGSTRKDA